MNILQIADGMEAFYTYPSIKLHMLHTSLNNERRYSTLALQFFPRVFAKDIGKLN